MTRKERMSMKKYLHHRVILRTAFWLYLITIVGFVSAQENIIVTGARYETLPWDIPGRIDIVSAADIAMSGAANIADLLRINAGIEVSDLFGDGTDASIGLRGFSSTAQQNTLVMVDGRRLNNSDISLPDLNSISLGNIERIEIVKGSMGALFGDKAVGGVINIITRRPEEKAVRLETIAGSYNTRSIFASFSDKLDNGLSFLISARRRLSDNYRDNNRLQLTDLSVKGSYEHDAGELFMEYQGISERSALPGALFEDMLELDRRQALNPADKIHNNTRSGRLGIRHEINEHFDLHAEYTNRFNDTRGILSSGGFPQDFESKRHHMEFTPRIISSFKLASREAVLTLGADIFETDYLIQSDFGITDDTQKQQGYYMYLSLPISDQLKASFAARHGRISENISVDTLSFGRSLPPRTRLHDTANAWQTGLSYLVTPALRIFANLDKNYRFVTADEYSAIADNNFFSELFASGVIVPLPHAQNGLSAELGTEWRVGENMASFQFYQLDIDDEIVFDPFLFLNTNLGNTRRRGIIAEAEYSPFNRVTLRADYSYLDGDFTNGDFKGEQLTFVTKHSGSIQANIIFNDNLDMHLEMKAQGRRRFAGDFSNNFSGLPAYTLLNINGVYHRGPFDVGLRINNITDTAYSDSGLIVFDFREGFPSPQVRSFYPAPGRNVMLTLAYNYLPD
jgi:iron complex outermembrane receptor protein